MSSDRFARIPWEGDIELLAAQVRQASDPPPDLSKDMIFFSNWLEDCGPSYSATLQLLDARAEFQTSQVKISHVKTSDAKSSLNTRMVLQHAEAFRHLMSCELSEQSLLKTHAILMKDMVREDGVVVTEGYRTTPCWAGSHRFLDAKHVKNHTRALIKDVNATIKSNSRDPLEAIYQAARLSCDLVMIHPFVDGNGRMSRLIMSYVLLRMGLFVIPLGFKLHKRAKSHYFWAIRSGRRVQLIATILLAGAAHAVNGKLIPSP